MLSFAVQNVYMAIISSHVSISSPHVPTCYFSFYFGGIDLFLRVQVRPPLFLMYHSGEVRAGSLISTANVSLIGDPFLI
jgi:hypothetical protein